MTVYMYCVLVGGDSVESEGSTSHRRSMACRRSRSCCI